MKQSFADLRHEMFRVSPLNGEGAICASVRKMSLDQASDCAGRIVELYGDIARQRDDIQVNLPLNDTEEARVPPFLVKSV